MSDEEAIRRTLALYCQLCDDGRFSEWETLYTEDATFSVMGRTYTGRDAIRTFIEQGQPPERRGKHICANSVIDLDGDGATARAETDYVFIARTEGGYAVTSAGRYLDRLTRVDDRWCFTERQIVILAP